MVRNMGDVVAELAAEDPAMDMVRFMSGRRRDPAPELGDVSAGDLVFDTGRRVVLRVVSVDGRRVTCADGSSWSRRTGRQWGAGREPVVIRPLTDRQTVRFLEWSRLVRAGRILSGVVAEISALTPDDDVVDAATGLSDRVRRALTLVDGVG